MSPDVQKALQTILEMVDILGWATCVTEAKDKNVGGLIIGHPTYIAWIMENLPEEYPGPSAGQELDS